MWKPPTDLMDRIYGDLAVTSLKAFKYPEEVIMYLTTIGKLIVSKQVKPSDLPDPPALLKKALESGWGYGYGYGSGTDSGFRRHIEYYVKRAADQVPQAALVLMMSDKNAGVKLDESDVAIFKAAYKQIGGGLMPVKIEGVAGDKVITAGDGKELLSEKLALEVLNEGVASANLMMFAQAGLHPGTFLKQKMGLFSYSQSLVNQLAAAKRWLPLPPEYRLNDMLIIHPDLQDTFAWLPWHLLVRTEDGGFIASTEGSSCPGCFKSIHEGWYCSPGCPDHPDKGAVHLRCLLCNTQWTMDVKPAKLPPGPKPPPEEGEEDAEPADSAADQ